MSNRTLKERIAGAVRQFEAGEIGLNTLKNSILTNGTAMEAMPYALVKEMDELEYKLTVSQFNEEEADGTSPEEALSAVKAWLANLPA